MWEFFGKILCINLREREDRYQYALQTFSNLMIPVSFYRTKRDPEGGLAGCYRSHLACARLAYEAGCESVLIFEDDVKPTSKFSLKRVQECIDFMKNNKDWNIFFLGCFPDTLASRAEKVEGQQSIYLTKAYGGHAYVMSRRFMEKFIKMEYIGLAVDWIYQGIDHAYGYFPCIFEQSCQGSDIQNFEWDCTKNNLLKLNEWWATNVSSPLIPLGVTFIVMMLLLLVLLMWRPAEEKWMWFFLILTLFFLFALVKL